MNKPINSNPDFKGAFGDKRIENRASQALRKLTLGRNSSLRQITFDDAEQRSFYRLFNNDNFSEAGITNSIVGRSRELCRDRHVLCIQDTVEFNLSSHQGRIKAESGLGTTSRDDVLGFMLHSSLVVDAEKSHAIGYSYIKTWERFPDAPSRDNYQQLPIEEKESYKWIAAAKQSKELLQDASCITIVADRESDIYDLFGVAEKGKVEVLIRSRHDRQIAGKQKLSTYLHGLPVMHQYNLSISGDIRKGVEKRIACMGLKWFKTELLKPRTCHDKELAETIPVYVVETTELNKSGKGIQWRILTTHEVSSAEDALQVILWYKERWHIEQIHRLLKTEGFRIESSQLEQGWAIRKLTLLAMMASLRIIQMMLSYQDDNEQSIEEVFEHKEIECLSMICAKYEGETEKTREPN